MSGRGSVTHPDVTVFAPRVEQGLMGTMAAVFGVKKEIPA